MFGYITPFKNELKIKDLENFRTYYCSICNKIKDKFGTIPRLGLNYDTTFFAVLLDSLSSNTNEIISTSCIRHPLSKRDFIASSNAIDYASDLNICLLYYKILDDTIDDNSLSSKFLLKTIKPYYKKITFNNISNILDNNLSKLNKMEQSNKTYLLDEICHPFSDLIGEIIKTYPFEINEDNEDTRRKIYTFGYTLGKCIYLFDALDDLEKDMNNFKFNPIENAYNNDDLSYNELIKKIKPSIDFNLISLISNCSEYLKILPLTKNKDIIKNVINLGLMDVYINIFTKL